MPSILPQMAFEESLTVTKIYRITGMLPGFGTKLLEDKQMTIACRSGSLTFQAYFMLIGAMNPCPCSWYGDPVKECT